MNTNTKQIYLEKSRCKVERERIADLFYNQENLKNKIGTAQRSLMESIYNLSRDMLASFEPFYEYRGFLIDVACLLTNPKISEQLQDDFNKENAGRLLRELLFFFEKLSIDEDLQDYLTWYNIQHFGGGLSEKQIEDLEETIINHQTKSTNP